MVPCGVLRQDGYGGVHFADRCFGCEHVGAEFDSSCRQIDVVLSRSRMQGMFGKSFALMNVFR
jgi:hypothetical protein